MFIGVRIEILFIYPSFCKQESYSYSYSKKKDPSKSGKTLGKLLGSGLICDGTREIKRNNLLLKTGDVKVKSFLNLH